MALARLAVFLWGFLTSVCALAADPADSIVNALKKSGQENQRLSYCILLAKANAPAGTVGQSDRKRSIEEASQKLKMNEPYMMRARADVARKGLYGYPKDANLALKLYLRTTKSPEAAWNAALMIYQNYQGALTQENAGLILDVFKKSGATALNAKGIAAAYAGYLAGQIEENGTAGKINIEKSFIDYRNSARNGYVPGMYQYMRQLYIALPKMQKAEQAVTLQEMRMMSNRWKWQSPEIMMLTGDLYASKFFPDEDGFLAQYHWRIAQKMGDVQDAQEFDTGMKSRIRRMSKEKEKKLEEAVEAGMRNVMKADHSLDFIDLCAE
jgi:hypothetical protein